MELESRVQNGMFFLDMVNVGWDEKINIEQLDLKYSCSCILGQLYHQYILGILRLGITHRHAYNFGFVQEGLFEVNIGYYNKLTTAWKNAILKRRAVREQIKQVGYQQELVTS